MEEERSLGDEEGINRASSVHTSTDDANESLSSIVIATAMEKHNKGQVRGIQTDRKGVRGERILTYVRSCLYHMKPEYNGLRAMKEVMLLLEREYPHNLSKMSLLFKVEFIAMICFHHGEEVTGLINAWEQSCVCTLEQKARLEFMWIQSRQITIERGVKRAFARCFKDINGTIWERKDDTWAPLDTTWPAYDLSM
jgi:hypothetical protein